MDLISVIMPSYNHANYIGKAIESVLAQTHRNLELIIVDDFSTDKSREIIKEWSLIDDRIKAVFHIENMGIAKTMNDGLDAAKGKFITQIASDDLFTERKLEKQIEILNREGCDISWTEAQIMDSESKLLGTSWTEFFECQKRTREGNLFFDLLIGNYINGSPVFRADCIDLIRWDTELVFLNDYRFWVDLAFLYEFSFLEESFFLYRLHDNNTNKSRKDEWLKDEINIKKYFLARYGDHIERELKSKLHLLIYNWYKIAANNELCKLYLLIAILLNPSLPDISERSFFESYIDDLHEPIKQYEESVEALVCSGLSIRELGLLADYLKIRGRIESARLVSKAVSLLKPSSDREIVLYSSACMEIDMPEKVLLAFDRRVASDPDGSLLYAKHAALGVSCLKSGKIGEALYYLDLALKSGPREPAIILAMGKALMKSGESNRAIEIFLDLEKNGAFPPEHLPLLYGALYSAGRASEALERINHYLELNANSPSAWLDKASVSFDLKKADDALACCDRAIALKKDYTQAYALKGDLFWILKKPSDAVVNYEKALEKDYGMPEIWFNRGICEESLDRHGEALKSFRNFIDTASGKNGFKDQIKYANDFIDEHSNSGFRKSSLCDT